MTSSEPIVSGTWQATHPHLNTLSAHPVTYCGPAGRHGQRKGAAT